MVVYGGKCMKAVVVVGIVFLLLTLLFIPIVSQFSGKIFAVDALKKDEIDQYVPSYVQPGDIVFMESGGFYSGSHTMSDPSWDHVAIYYGNNTWIEAMPTKGVRYGNFSNNNWAKIFAYGYVKTASESQRLGAVSFAVSQLGKSYQDLDWHKPWTNRTKDSDINSSAWYCSELVWAAYYNVGIDIDRNGWRLPPRVMPIEISSDKDVEMYPAYKDIPWNEWHLGMYLSWFMQYIIATHH
jgi:uncharacterized protein YycO